jgi:soluble lytic murein transglycosylase
MVHAPTPRSVAAPVVRPPLAVSELPRGDVKPVIDLGPPESESLVVVREILEARATELGELEREGVARALVQAEKENGLPALLMLALIEQESRFDPDAVGIRGSIGLMQVRPFVGRDVALRNGIPWQEKRTLRDPVANVRIGTAYLAELRARFDDVDMAMAAYNIGPTRVARRLEAGRKPRGPYLRRIHMHYHAMRIEFGDPPTAIGG